MQVYLWFVGDGRPTVAEVVEDPSLAARILVVGVGKTLASAASGGTLADMLPAEADTVEGETYAQAVDGWLEYLSSKGRCRKYRALAGTTLHAWGKAAGWLTVPAIAGRGIDDYLTWLGMPKPDGGGVGGRSQNAALAYLSSFLSWCVRTERRKDNPAKGWPKAREFRGEGSDAFSAKEYQAVHAAAKRDAESAEPRFGATHRARLYRVLWHSGLRIGEAHKLCVRDVRENPRRLALPPRTNKAKVELEEVPLHPDAWAALMEQIPKDAKPADLVFPFVHERCLKADIKAAGLKAQGRTLGFHSFRKGLGTELALTGAHPRIAQEVLRHSDIRLTMKLYTKAKLLPISDAVSLVAAVGCANLGEIRPKPVDAGVEIAEDGGADKVSIPMQATLPNTDPRTPGRLAHGPCQQTSAAGTLERPGFAGREAGNLPPVAFGPSPRIAGAGFEPAPALAAGRRGVGEPDNSGSWCSGSTVGCEPAGPGSNPGGLNVVVDSAQAVTHQLEVPHVKPTAPLSHRDNECASRAETTGSAGIANDSTDSHGAISSPLLRSDGAQAGFDDAAERLTRLDGPCLTAGRSGSDGPRVAQTADGERRGMQPRDLPAASSLSSTDPNYLRGVAAGILLVAAALGAAEGAPMLLRVLQPVRPVVVAASDLCYEAYCSTITDLGDCLKCCDTRCAYNPDAHSRCEDKCLENSGVLKSPVSALGRAERALRVAQGDDAIRLAGVLADAANNNEDTRTRAFALAMATKHPLAVAMLHNEQGERR